MLLLSSLKPAEETAQRPSPNDQNSAEATCSLAMAVDVSRYFGTGTLYGVLL